MNFHLQLCFCNQIHIYPPGNKHISYKGTFEYDFPFPKVGYVDFLEGTICKDIIGSF